MLMDKEAILLQVIAVLGGEAIGFAAGLCVRSIYSCKIVSYTKKLIRHIASDLANGPIFGLVPV